MKYSLKMIPIFSRAAQILFTLIALQLPMIGYCDSGSGWFKNLFESKGKNMNEVAVKVAELPEDKSVNIWGLDFSPDGKYLAATSPTTLKVQIWDWQNKRIVRTLEMVSGENTLMTTEPIRYSPDGRFLAWCGGVITKIWNTETWAIIHEIVDLNYRGCNAIDFTPDGKSLVQVIGPMGSGNNLTIYDTASWQPMWSLRTIPFYPTALSIRPDGKFVALGGGVYDDKGAMTQQIALVDLAQRAIVRTIPNTVNFDLGHLAWCPDGANITVIGRRASDYSISLGKEFFTSGPDTVMVFDAHNGKQIAGEQFEDVEGGSLRYTSDGKYLIEGVMNGRGSGQGVRIWDGQHRELLQEIPGEVGSLAVSRDGRYFAVGEVGKTIVWQLK